MLATLKQNDSAIAKSKIQYKSSVPHPLARFVCEKTVAFLFSLKPEEIYRIDCWRHVVYVHGKGVSRFVSYGDFPPILEVDPPTNKDSVYWYKRWRKQSKSKTAPEFWTKFYTQKFKEAPSVAKLLDWGQLLAFLKSAFSERALQRLRENYSYEKYFWHNF